MLKSISVLSLVASVAFAQQSLIPTGLQSTCTDFLKSLNEDPAIAPCLNSIISATSAFASGFQGGKPPSTSAVTSALNTLCSDSTKCSESVMRTTLTGYWAACSADLQGGNPDAKVMYDTLYMLIPLRKAVCSKDDTGSWCLTSITQSISQSSKAMIDNYLVVQNRAVANSTTICSSNLPFAFIDQSLPSNKLCSICTKKILSAYIDFESNTPYAPGMGNTVLLCGQNALYDAVTAKCPDLLGGAVQAAGGLSSGFGSGSKNAASTFQLNIKGAVATVLSVGVLAFF